jgi:hypothetical protein
VELQVEVCAGLVAGAGGIYCLVSLAVNAGKRRIGK